MDPKSLRTLQILDELSKGSDVTQRDLSKTLGVALGLVNRYVKRLIKKGYIEVTHIERNRLHYLLTPQGVKEKSSLTCRYLQRSYNLFKDLRERATECFQKLAKEGSIKVVFYGTSEVAEVAFLSLYSAGLKLVGVVDGNLSVEMFCGQPVIPIETLKDIVFDKVVIVQLDYEKDIENNLLAQGVPEDKICWFGDGQ